MKKILTICTNFGKQLENRKRGGHLPTLVSSTTSKTRNKLNKETTIKEIDNMSRFIHVIDLVMPFSENLTFLTAYVSSSVSSAYCLKSLLTCKHLHRRVQISIHLNRVEILKPLLTILVL